MGSKARLSPEDRNFFSLVTRSVYINPFIDERKQLLFRISPDWSPGRSITPELEERVGRLDQKGLNNLQDFVDDDAALIFHAYLYLEYLRFFPDLKELVQKQLEHREASVAAGFAASLIGSLQNRGFSKNQASRYLSIFYQLVRAFFFISNALVGECPSMKELRIALWNNVFTFDVGLYDRHLWNRMEDFSTLLLGETGTGKGSAAGAIGRSCFIPFDDRKNCFAENFTEIFVTINLSQYPESLIESELFGHRKGAFTGAVENHKGLFERCSSHGALFIDEIGDINIPIQIKLLQVLQERTFSPVGSHGLKRFEGRVIAATNRSLKDLRKAGRFRSDFFYRLCSDIIIVPTLRQRIAESPSELEVMTNLLVARITGEESRNLTDMVLEIFKRDLPPNYQWPGNVRELEQAIRSVLVKRRYGGDSMAFDIEMEKGFEGKFLSGKLEARELLKQYCQLLYKRYGTYEKVATQTKLDPRTVKKYLGKRPE